MFFVGKAMLSAKTTHSQGSFWTDTSKINSDSVKEKKNRWSLYIWMLQIVQNTTADFPQQDCWSLHCLSLEQTQSIATLLVFWLLNSAEWNEVSFSYYKHIHRELFKGSLLISVPLLEIRIWYQENLGIYGLKNHSI